MSVVRVRITDEALSLFAPLAPCSVCRRPLPVPFKDDYRHWEGCSVGEREKRQQSEDSTTIAGGDK